MTASATLPLLTTDTSEKPTATLRWLVAVCFLWASGLAVTALWVAGGGIQALTAGYAETLNTIGRITGLAAALLLLYQVLLMARVPLFERAFGRDGITRMHRWVGFSSFWLFSAHIVLLVLGYAAQAGMNPLLQLWVFIWNYPGMLLATAGTLLLLLVVVTSIRRARRRLRYESWHLLHLYGYLGAGLAVPHMLWTGADFLYHPLAAAAWWVLWGATAAAVLVYRIAIPLLRSARHGIRVHSVTPDGAHGVSVRMRGRRLDALGARSGQFFVWRFLDGPGWTRGHPFSLAAAPDGHELVIAARITGDGTRRLTTLRPGTRVMIEGPYGEMTGRARRGRKLLLLGAGAGVAPLIALLESEHYAPGAAILVTRDHADAEIMRSEAIARLVEHRGLRYGVLNGPRARTGSSWLPASHAAWDGADLLRRLAGDLDAYDVFVCGPAAWMSALRVDLRRAGVPADRIHSESFTV